MGKTELKNAATRYRAIARSCAMTEASAIRANLAGTALASEFEALIRAHDPSDMGDTISEFATSLDRLGDRAPAKPVSPPRVMARARRPAAAHRRLSFREHRGKA